MEDLPQLARAASASIRAFESLPKNSPRAAALQLLGAAIENFYDHGWFAEDIVELAFRIDSDRREADLS
jgi:hypothetical protein